MGMRFRKSFKIAPGVKLNLSKRGIGVSAGVKGARVSLNSKGRVTKSVGIPGTGISYVSWAHPKRRQPPRKPLPRHPLHLPQRILPQIPPPRRLFPIILLPPPAER